MRRVYSVLLILLTIATTAFALPNAPTSPTNPIVFVGQVPVTRDFATVNATFGNQNASVEERAFSDLYIRYPDGTIKNLTRSAGYGNDGLQGANSIAVRDPTVDFSGNKVIFSMVVGAAIKQYQVNTYRWQIYEITGLGINDTPSITKVKNQPTNYNNIYPIYSSEGDIFFISDRPHLDRAHLYPELDEYESTATNTGLYKLTVNTGVIQHIDHAPSGDFHPILDSFGRVVFTRWDHLQRDQQAGFSQSGQDKGYGAFDYSSEDSNASKMQTQIEFFPEALNQYEQDKEDPAYNHHRINTFFPWMVNQDGTELETLNHIGRHELHGYLEPSKLDDKNLDYFYSQYARFNTNSIESCHQIVESSKPGTYYCINGPEFGTHASGQIVALDLPPGKKAGEMQVEYLTHKVTSTTSQTPPAYHVGLFRDPLELSSGTLIASHSGTTLEEQNIGTSAAPLSRYSFRLRYMTLSGNVAVPDQYVTSGITRSISFWQPDYLISFSNVTLWELNAIEIKQRQIPPVTLSSLPNPESSIFQEEGISVENIKNKLSAMNSALLVGRDVTSRDSLDRQQPFNLQVPGGIITKKNNGKLYDVTRLQFFFANLVRGYGGVNSPKSGRRAIAYPHTLSDTTSALSDLEGAKIFPDGSYAAIVPAERALTWQLNGSDKKAVIRERLWLTFKKGEIRVCASCHGVTSTTQAGGIEPENKPEALRHMIRYLEQLPAPPVMTITPKPENTPVATASPSPGDNNGNDNKIAVSIELSKNIISSKKTFLVNVRNKGSSIFNGKIKLVVKGLGCSGSKKVSVAAGRTTAIKLQAPNNFKVKNQSGVAVLVDDAGKEVDRGSFAVKKGRAGVKSCFL